MKAVRQCSPPGWGLVLAAFLLAVFFSTDVMGIDWVFYCASGREEAKGLTLRDWYGLNSLKCTPKIGASSYHYYDLDSLASNSPFPGGTFRVWEKSVLQKETETYDETRETIIKEEEIRRKRKINELDYAWLFPTAVNRAAKEITTLFEIDCGTERFFILEGDNYDKAGQRMTRETAFDSELRSPIQPKTVMEALFQNVCNE